MLCGQAMVGAMLRKVETSGERSIFSRGGAKEKAGVLGLTAPTFGA